MDSLEFADLHVPMLSTAGTSFYRRVKVGVPKVPVSSLRNVIYLYNSVPAAKEGRANGGSGFLVGVASEALPGGHYIYAVTNYHVAVRDGASVVRINTHAGPPDVLDFDPAEWHFDPKAGNDIAVIPLPIDGTKHDIALAEYEMLLPKSKMNDEHPIGVGEDVFMIGRFVDHDGATTNVPAARFGHISINPTLMRSPYFGNQVEMFCLDTNSRTGYSGSPVYVYRTATSDLEQLQDPAHHGKVLKTRGPMMMLLGIHCGQFPEWWDVDNYEDKPDHPEDAESLQYISKAQIKGVSGMTRVAPAWAVAQLLDSPKLKEARDRSEEHIRSLGRSAPTDEVLPATSSDGA